MTEQDIERNK